MKHKRRKALAATALAGLLLGAAGCGGSAGGSHAKAVTTAPQSSAGRVVATKPGTPDTSPATAPIAGREVHIAYVSPDGWRYLIDTRLPTVTVSLTTDVATSPPGQARLRTTLVGERPRDTSSETDNPGRHGPSRDLRVGGIVVTEAQAIADFREDNGQSIGPCQSLSSDTFPHAVECSLTPSYPTSAETPDMEQSAVNTITLNKGAVFYEYNWAAGDGWDPLQKFGAVGYDCTFYLSPLNGIRFNRLYNPSLCGRVSVRMF